MSEATPANAATPSTGSENDNSPPATQQAQPPAGQKDGTVVISTAEYAQLQRQAARAQSAQRRVYQKPSKQAPSVDSDDPASAAIAEANRRAEEAEQRAMQLEIRGSVRELLADERFKNLPESTKELILQSPQALSSANTLEEAMYDIEDKLIEMSGKHPSQPNSPNQAPASSGVPNAPTGQDTPPATSPGAPAPVDANVFEDTSNLRGVARSTAVLRNTLKKQVPGVIRQ